MFKSIKCFFGFHKYEKLIEEGIYGGDVTSWKCKRCEDYVPHWTPKGWKLNGKKYPKYR